MNKIVLNEPEVIFWWRSSCEPTKTGASFVAAERLPARPRSCRTCPRTSATTLGPYPTPGITVFRTGKKLSLCRSAARRGWLKLELKFFLRWQKLFKLRKALISKYYETRWQGKNRNLLLTKRKLSKTDTWIKGVTLRSGFDLSPPNIKPKYF